MIADAQCIDMTASGDVILCPVCHEECERLYFKAKNRFHILGCEGCIDYEDSSEYLYRKNN